MDAHPPRNDSNSITYIFLCAKNVMFEKNPGKIVISAGKSQLSQQHGALPWL